MALRLGIVGADGSHAPGFLTEVRRRPDRDGILIITDEHDARALASSGVAPDLVVDDDHAFRREIDAALITHRDPADRERAAAQLIAAGRPVFVDKQLAPHPEAAQLLVSTARRAGVLIESGSALRWAPLVCTRSAQHRGSRPTEIALRGPGRRDDPSGGLGFYGIHIVETALAVLDDPDPRADVRVDVELLAAQTMARLVIDGVEILLSFESSRADGAAPFAMRVRPGDAGFTPIELGEGYLRPVLASFLSTLGGRRRPSPRRRLIGPVVVMEAVVRAAAAAESRSGSTRRADA